MKGHYNKAAVVNISNILFIAGSGLSSLNQQLAVVSQNVANANTPGYARETATQSSVVAGGSGIGVRSAAASRNVDIHLQADAFAAGADAAGQQITSDALKLIDATSGAPGSGTDLSSLIGALTDAFSTLSNDPSSATQQNAVVQKAGQLARGINGLAHTVAQVRQNAQDEAVTQVSTLNTALRTVGLLSSQITAAAARGESTANLEDQRDANMQSVTTLTGAKFLRQPDGSVLAALGGLVLPLQASKGPFTLSGGTIGPAGPPAATPQLLLNGENVTSQVTGGQIGANLGLRDRILPALQTKLDQFTTNLAAGFASQGLMLFADQTGALPSAIGAALTIQVSDAVRATPSLVRDGASPTGLAGDATLINNLLKGTLASGVNSVTDQALNVTSYIASQSADAVSNLSIQQGVSTALTSKLSSNEGVSVDTELAHLVQLQNSYAANAKVLSSTNTAWSELLAAVML